MPSVLITGCSDAGMGAALAREFHRAGWHVYATARSVGKMASLRELGLELLQLDVSDTASIAACAKQIPTLDMIINNAANLYTMPIADLAISEARQIYDVNVWGPVAVTQAFLPRLRKSSRPVVVNHTSIGTGIAIPFQVVYNSSKAALAMVSDTMRLELKAFGIQVVNLKTGGVKTNILKNAAARKHTLPEGSIYTPAKSLADRTLTADWAEGKGIPAEQWAREVCRDLQKTSLPLELWRGESAWLGRISAYFPSGFFDNMMKKMTGMDQIEEVLLKSQ